MTRAFSLLLLLTACDGGSKDPVDDTDPPATDDTDTGGGGDDTDLPEGARILGTLKDASGALITEGVRLQYCRGTQCLTANAFEAGAFAFNGLTPGFGSFEVVPLGDSNLASVFAPVEVATDQVKDIGAIVVPAFGPDHTLQVDEEEFEVATGLFLTAAAGDLEPPTPFDPAPTAIRGVDATANPAPIEGLAGTLLAMWYLGPFDAHAPDGLGVRIVDTWGLDSGDAELWAGDYATAAWIKVGDLDDDGADNLTPSAGAKLGILSTLVVVRKP